MNRMERNRDTRVLGLTFLIPTLVMLVIFIIKGIYPFGDRSFLFSDMYHQYMPFFSEFMRMVKGGENLSFTWNVGIGSNFLALYGYYLASPLHWLAFLFPQEYLMEFMSYLVVIKIGLSGLSSGIYLRKHYGIREDWGVPVFGTLYALSGFMTAYNWNIMWLDCVILLPLILLGLEQLVKESKCTLYCVTLGLSILTNFYISIMICIFLVLYFLYLILTEKCSLRILCRFALYSLLAGGMAAVLLIPEVFAILETDFGDMDFPKKLESYFSVLDMLARHCMCIGTERGLDHWPNIYSGVICFLMLPLYVLNQRIPARKRFGLLALAGILLLGFSTNILDFVWHGLNYPDSLPARQSFIYIFLILIMCADAYRCLRETEPVHIIKAYLGAVVFLLFVEKFASETDHFETWVEFLNLIFVTGYAVILYLWRTRGDRNLKQLLSFTLLVVIIIESSLNMFNTSVGTVSRSQYLDELDDYVLLYEEAQEEQEGFFRMEKFSRKTKNDGTLAGYPTASVFSSTMNSYVMDMYKRLGMRYSKVYYGFDGATAFTSALLNVAYLYGTEKAEEGPLYPFVNDSEGISLYRAEATLPFGYVAPTGFDLPAGFSNNGLKLQNRMVTNLGVKGKLFTETKSTQKEDDVVFTADEDGYYYGILTASGTSEAEAKAGGRKREFRDLKNGQIMHLGYLEKGTKMTISNSDEEDATPKVKADIYRMDQAVLQEALEILGASAMTDVTWDNDSIAGKLVLEENGRLILSVPFEKGWTVSVNEKEVQPELFGEALIALDLEPGSYDISLHYEPYGWQAGVLVSIVSALMFSGIVLYRRRQNQKRKKLLLQEAEAAN